MNALVEQFKVIDTDTHVIEPYDLYTARVSAKKYGDKVPHVRWNEDRQADTWYFGNKVTGNAAGAAMAGWREYPPDFPKRLSEAEPYTWNAQERLKVMDRYGIYAQILYPNVVAGGFGAGNYLELNDTALMMDCVTAYNDWITEWCSAAPQRLIAQTTLPFWDVDLTIKEMERCAKMGHKGVVMCSEPEFFNLPRLTDPRWDRFWAAAQDMQLPINFHVGTGDMSIMDLMHERVGRHAHFASMGALFSLNNGRAISQIICGGICHAFPKLNFVSVESGIGWLPFFLDSLDYQWKNCGVAKEHPEYGLLPSEFFKRQFYGCFWFERGTLKPTIELMGDDNLMYETDFPHPTSMSPGPATSAIKPADYIELVFKDLPRESQQKILHGNAARIYHLD
jgi:predicted TIM-barrel fold metal-dependent hydrolase